MVKNKKACAPVQQCILIHITLYPQIVAGLHLSPVPTACKSYDKTYCEEIDPMNEQLSEMDSGTRNIPDHPRFLGCV